MTACKRGEIWMVNFNPGGGSEQKPVQLARSVDFNARELNEIRKLVLENLSFLKEKWHEYFGG